MALEHFGLTLITPPASEPVALTDAKAWLRVDSDDTSQDTVIIYLITSARQRCERVTCLALITQTWQLTLDRFPSTAALWDPSAAAGDYARLGPISDPRAIKLMRPPLQSVTSIQYTDLNSTVQTLPAPGSSNPQYQVDTYSFPGRILPAYSTFWPVALPVVNAVTVTYVAGYGSASAVPGEITQALFTHLAYCYRNREEQDQEYLDSLFEPFATWAFR